MVVRMGDLQNDTSTSITKDQQWWRLVFLKSIIAGLHYHSEQAFSYDTFVTNLNGAFLTLAECQQPKTEREKVNVMIKKTQNTHQDIRAGIALIRTNATLHNDFCAAAN